MKIKWLPETLAIIIFAAFILFVCYGIEKQINNGYLWSYNFNSKSLSDRWK